jgi:hypothetical protein
MVRILEYAAGQNAEHVAIRNATRFDKTETPIDRQGGEWPAIAAGKRASLAHYRSTIRQPIGQPSGNRVGGTEHRA